MLWKEVLYFPKTADNLGSDALYGRIVTDLGAGQFELALGPLPGALVPGAGETARVNAGQDPGHEPGYFDLLENITAKKSE